VPPRSNTRRPAGRAVAARPLAAHPPFPTPGPILETDYVNPQRFARGSHTVRDHRSTWPSNFVGGKTFLTLGSDKYDWVSIIDPDSEYEQPAVGLSGTVIGPELSGSDNPFLHPFLNDYEFYVAPDQRYLDLLAPRMTDDSYKNATKTANTKFGLNVPGVIGMEWDGRLVPSQFRPAEGDRVALFGRWIIDTGHEDFHTEIHPPLLMATAGSARSSQQAGSRAGKNDATIVRIISRPYLVSQEFGDGGLLEHLIKEVGKVTHPLIPLSFQVEAHPRLLDMPFRGFHLLTFKVRPPTPRADIRDELMVEFTFTRRSKAIAVQMLRGNDNESLRVVIVFNENGYEPPPKPASRQYTITLDELEAMDKTAGQIYRDVIFASILSGPAAPIILNRGIKSTKYAAPTPPVLRPVTRIPLGNLAQPETPIDASQPYPLFGTVKLEWQRFGVAAPPGQRTSG
jgi:hypothetical protein